MRFRDLNIRTKQLIAFGLVLVVLSSSSALIIHQMTKLKESFDEVATNWLPRSIAIAELSRGISNYRTLALQHALTSDSKARSALEMMIELQIDQIDDYLDRYESLSDESRQRGLLPPEEDSLYELFDTNWEEYQTLFQEWFLLSQQNDAEAAQTLIASEGAILHDNIRMTLEELVDNINTESSIAAVTAEAVHEKSRKIFLILFIVSMVLAAIIAIAMTRFIVGPLKQLAGATEEVSHGNLEQHLEVKSRDEIGSLSKSFNTMAVALKEARDKTEEQAEKLRYQNTELEKTLKQLNETQEELLLKEKMASLGKLVASVAHEINNPIGSVLGAADVAKRAVNKLKERLQSNLSDVDIKSDDMFKRALHALDDNTDLTIKAGNRIAEIVKSLKNFSKLDEAEYQTVDIHDGIESSLVLLGQKKLSHIKVVKEYGNLSPLGCYPGLLNQVFMNILSNAAEAIMDRGTITVKTSQDNSEVVIKISDTGIGIPKEKISKLFDFGFSTGSSRVKMGTGLITAFSIVQKHGGRIEVESEVGRGSIFSVVIPNNGR